MGKAKSRIVPEQVTLSLLDPGMTAMHKVGLAGLWMTLKALEKDTAVIRSLPTGSGWRLDDRSVTLVYGTQPKLFCDWLIRASFRLDSEGLFWFPALGSPSDSSNYQHPIVLQDALLGTFLQHGLTRKADPVKKPTGSREYTIGGMTYVVQFRRVKQYAHQNEDITPGEHTRLAGWTLPGGAERHSALGATSLTAPAEHALLLRFAVVGAIYFKIKTIGEGVRPSYSLVLPEVTNLADYARIRSRFLTYGVRESLAAGTADAGLRVLAELESAGLLPDLKSASCRVISFGTLPWSEQQKSRVHLMDVRPSSASALKVYAVSRTVLFPRLVRPKNSDPFWDVPLVPDLVARNAIAGQDWYVGFADLVADKDRRRHVFEYEKGGLVAMVSNPQVLPTGPELIFVQACHEALRRHMGQKHGRPGGADWATEFERIRVSIARCKNAAALRETITSFWSRGGALHKGENTLLVAGDDWWQQVLPLFSDQNWRKAKDLALLALASYPGSKEKGEAS